MGRYLFAVVLISGVVDLLLLIAVGYLTHWQIRWMRLALSLALGMLYVGACLYCGVSTISRNWVRICILTLMGYIAYGFSLSSSRRTALFVLLSMTMSALASSLEEGDFIWLVLSASVLALICLLGFGSGGGREYFSVLIPNGEKCIRITALMDTGNLLCDPLSGQGVMIVGSDVAAQMVGLTAEELSRPLETIQYHRGLRLIPYTAVGQSGGMLLGKMVDGVTIGNQRRKCVIAFAPNIIGGTGFNALMGGLT